MYTFFFYTPVFTMGNSKHEAIWWWDCLMWISDSVNAIIWQTSWTQVSGLPNNNLRLNGNMNSRKKSKEYTILHLEMITHCIKENSEDYTIKVPNHGNVKKWDPHIRGMKRHCSFSPVISTYISVMFEMLRDDGICFEVYIRHFICNFRGICTLV